MGLLGLLGGSKNNSVNASPSQLNARASNPPRLRRTLSDVESLSRTTDSSSIGSVDNPPSESSTNNNINTYRSPLPRSQSFIRQNSNNKNNQSARYECRDPPHFDLQDDPYYSTNANVKVMIRIRPLSESEISSNGHWRCVRQESAHSLTWVGHPQTPFTFDHVASEFVTQEEVFNVVGAPMVENCLAGYNSCMFAYGQTGSGKTHTILGDLEGLDTNPSKGCGLTPRIIEHLFTRIQQEEYARKHESLKFSCKCSFLEIYNEHITDLLEPTSTNLLVREDHKRGVYVEKLTEVAAMSVQDAIGLLRKGFANRKVAVTNMNKESSRSHSIFTCSVQCRNGSLKKTVNGLLHLVDLAGSERQKLSGAEGDRLKEAANINKSLSTLGFVIMNLVDIANGKERHVPYRQSKLTFLLQNSLGGNSKTTVIANISPSSCSAEETLSTLKFAQRAKFIKNDVVCNEDTAEDVLMLRAQVEQLKRELQRTQYIQRGSYCSYTTPPQRSNNFHEFSQIPSTDPSSDLESLYVDNGTQISSSPSPCVSNAKYIGQVGDCPMNRIRKIQSLEGIVAGSLRRELEAERLSKHLSTEIEYLRCLVRQREEENQCSRMLLKFREHKISRMESATAVSISSATSLLEENKSLKEEIKLLQGRLDRNPELIRFAMENIKLIDELRRYQEFYECGERDLMMKEISNLRDELSELLDWKQQQEQSTGKDKFNQSQLLSNIENKSWNTLSMFSKANLQMVRHIDEIQTQLVGLKTLCTEQKQMIDTSKSEPGELSEEQFKHVDAEFKASPMPCGFEVSEIKAKEYQLEKVLSIKPSPWIVKLEYKR